MVHASRGPARARVGRTCCREVGHRVPAGRPRCWADDADRLGGVRPTDYDAIRDHIAPRDPRLRGLQRARRPTVARRLRACRTPPRDERRFPTGHRQGPVHRCNRVRVPEAARRAGCCCRPCARHDQYNTTIYGLDDRYRGIKNGRRVVLVNPEDLASLGFADGSVRRPGERVGGRVDRRAPTASGSWPTRPRAGAPPRTSRRPTCWCRWTPSPTTATRRRRSPSWSAWSRSPDRPARRSPVHRRLHDDGGLTGVCTTTRRGTYPNSPCKRR